ncbi:hypothetical protein ACOZ4F_01260 (plasmid) [Haloarcula marismortui]|uniref:hypothetical protein n=1 Tax=Haloarcula marismortui TaxID=2238 RepID=UPI003C72FB17
MTDHSGSPVPNSKLEVVGIELSPIGWENEYGNPSWKMIIGGKLVEDAPEINEWLEKPLGWRTYFVYNKIMWHLLKILRSLYRNIFPSAKIWMEASVIIKTQNCHLDSDISNASDNPYVPYSNLSHIKSVENVENASDIYRIKIDSYSPDIANRAIRLIGPSEYIEPDYGEGPSDSN